MLAYCIIVKRVSAEDFFAFAFPIDLIAAVIAPNYIVVKCQIDIVVDSYMYAGTCFAFFFGYTVVNNSVVYNTGICCAGDINCAAGYSRVIVSNKVICDIYVARSVNNKLRRRLLLRYFQCGNGIL